MITHSRRRMAEAAVVEYAPSYLLGSKDSKEASYASIEHREFAQPSEVTINKKGFAGLLKRLKSSTTGLGRMQCSEQRPTTNNDKTQDRTLDSLDEAKHIRVGALLGEPNDPDDVFNNELVRTHANSSNHNYHSQLSESELQTMFLGASRFQVSYKQTFCEGSVQKIGEDRGHLPEYRIPGTVSFEEYFRNASDQDAKPEVLLWDRLLHRVFGNYSGFDGDVPQDSSAPITDQSAANVTPRAQAISQTEAHERTSHPYGPSTSPPTREEFTTPTDSLPVLGNATTFESLTLLPAPDSGSPVPTLTFTSPANRRLPSLDLALLHDVRFVASHPCSAPEDSTSRSLGNQRTSEVWGDCLPSDFLAAEVCRGGCSPADSACSFGVRAREPHAHPLHESYGFEVVPAACLLSMPPGEEGGLTWGGDEGSAVVMLDCRDSEDLELLGRAWCARVGEHAVVSKAGRTCIACSVREARALGFGVVIRI